MMIRKYLKEDYPNLEYNGTPITLLNLANLTLGLPNWMPDKDIFSKADPNRIPFILDSVHTIYSRQDLHQVKLKVLLGAFPGTAIRQHNCSDTSWRIFIMIPMKTC